MKNKYIGGILALMLFVGGSSVSAQRIKDADRAKQGGGSERIEKTQKAEEGVKGAKNIGREKRKEIVSTSTRSTSTASTSAASTSTKKEAIRAERDAKKGEAKAIIEKKREEVKATRETKKAELESRLKALKDEKKQQIVRRVAERFGDVNTRITNHLEKAVEKIEALTKRIENRADALESEGNDLTAVRSVIQEVFQAIEAARAGIAVQTEKVYSVGDVIQDETTVGKNISALRDTLRSDLKALEEMIRVAKEKVRLAGEALKNSVVPASQNKEDAAEEKGE